MNRVSLIILFAILPAGMGLVYTSASAIPDAARPTARGVTKPPRLDRDLRAPAAKLCVRIAQGGA